MKSIVSSPPTKPFIAGCFLELSAVPCSCIQDNTNDSERNSRNQATNGWVQCLEDDPQEAPHASTPTRVRIEDVPPENRNCYLIKLYLISNTPVSTGHSVAPIDCNVEQYDTCFVATFNQQIGDLNYNLNKQYYSPLLACTCSLHVWLIIHSCQLTIPFGWDLAGFS